MITPGGQVEGVTMLRDGVVEGAMAIEHGYGHRELGARAHYIDGEAIPGEPANGAGGNLNDVGLTDPSHPLSNAWVNWVSGASVRQGLPARIKRMA